MSALLAELASREILTAIAVKRLREYISNKYPHLSPASRAGIFADAVHRIVAGRLPELPKDKIGLFRSFLYGAAAKKQAFSIDCADVFKSSLRLRTADEHFVKGLALWLEETLLTPVSEDKVFEYVSNACRILEEAPDTDIEKVLEAVENVVGDIRPRKRVISLIRMHPSAGGNMAEARKDGAWETADTAAGETAAAIDAEYDREQYEGREVSGNGAGKENRGREVNGAESIGEDWIIVRKRRTAAEIIAGKMSGLTGYITRFWHRITDLTAGAVSKGSRYRAVAISGLFAAALLLTFLSALYVKGAMDAKSGKDGLMPETAGIVVVDEAMIPAGTAIITDAAGYGDNTGEVMMMRATAYDLSVESCGKDRDHPEYGITYSGTRAAAGRTVAVDPEVIPLGSTIRITFPEEYSHLNGIYVAEDTGRLIKGDRIDIFFGEDEAGSREVNRKALEFGVRYVEVEILDTRQALR
jgi:3D (Asp-Asp-Asp) domain-containing protein